MRGYKKKKNCYLGGLVVQCCRRDWPTFIWESVNLNDKSSYSLKSVHIFRREGWVGGEQSRHNSSGSSSRLVPFSS